MKRSSVDNHPAQLAWVSHAAMGTGDARIAMTNHARVEHCDPPLPCAWMVFEKPLCLWAFTTDPGDGESTGDQVFLLRSVEWSHCADGSVLLGGYTCFVGYTGIPVNGPPVVVITHPNRGLLPTPEVRNTILSPRELITGGDAIPPLSHSGVPIPRMMQKMLVSLVHEVWRRWAEPCSGYASGEVFLPEVEPIRRARSAGAPVENRVRVLVLGRTGQQFPELGEIVPWTSTRAEPDHRWNVRGHWRNQPCGPGGRYRRRIWVPEHTAGPPDKPLRDTPKVLALR